jgi:protein SFI1
VTFSLRSNSNVLALAFRNWHEAHVTHQNANYFAVNYHSVQLRYAMLLSWRIKLRDKLNLIKMARRADSFFAVRRAYKIWRGAFGSRVREKILRDVQQRQVMKIFNGTLGFYGAIIEALS